MQKGVLDVEAVEAREDHTARGGRDSVSGRGSHSGRGGKRTPGRDLEVA